MFVTQEHAGSIACPHLPPVQVKKESIANRVIRFLLAEPPPPPLPLGRMWSPCMSTRCMGWRWHREPKLTYVERIDLWRAVSRSGSDRVMLDALLERSGVGAMIPYPDEEGMEGIALEAVMESAATFLNGRVRELQRGFVCPKGGWRHKGYPEVVLEHAEGIFVLIQEFVRDADPQATGYCSLGHNPYMPRSEI